jgi:hypothetical protein
LATTPGKRFVIPRTLTAGGGVLVSSGMEEGRESGARSPARSS